MSPSRRGRTTLWEQELRQGLPAEAGVTEAIHSLLEMLLRTAARVKHLAFQNLLGSNLLPVPLVHSEVRGRGSLGNGIFRGWPL